MADNVTVDNGTLSDYVVRTEDLGSGIHAQAIVVAPWMPTVVASAQYSLDVTTSSVVTLTVPATATHALITVEDADVRFTEDSSSPTTGAAGSGLLLPAGFIGELALPNALKFIAVTATAELNVTYRKYV